MISAPHGDRMESLVPLGDQAALAYFADESAALRFANSVRNSPETWLVDVVSAYKSVAVFFDLDQINFKKVAGYLQEMAAPSTTAIATIESRLHHIPCCYENQLDLELVAAQTKLTAEDVIRLHAATEYTIYAIGFSPGFPYLGYLPEPLCGVQRLATPRLRVEPGSVGLTGRQTGIYPEVRPGGWNLIGRTPVQLVDVADNYFPLRAGDRVRFVRIDESEFSRLLGQRLS